MLGVVGDSAAGKTTFTRGVGRLLGAAGVTPLCLDDYHRYDRAERLARGLTANDPAANNLELMAAHLSALRGGGLISKPVYDHRSGSIRGPELVAATGLVIAYGMLTLTPPSLAELFDLTIYLDPAAELRQHWRLGRDVDQRGYTASEVRAQHEARNHDAIRFIHGQRRHADLVLRFAPADGPGDAELPAELLARRTSATRAIADFLIFADSSHSGLNVRRSFRDDDERAVDLFKLDATLDATRLAALQGWLLSRLAGLPAPDIGRLGTIGAGPNPARSETLALLQILVAYLLVNR